MKKKILVKKILEKKIRAENTCKRMTTDMRKPKNVIWTEDMKTYKNTIVKGFVVFTLYSFLLSLSTMEINSAIAEVCKSRQVSLYYALFLLLNALGFAAVGFLNRHLKAQRPVVLVAGIFYLISMLGVFSYPAGIGAFIFICPLALGVIGGNVYYKTAYSLGLSLHMGLLTGSAYSLAVLIQYFTQNFVPNRFIRVFFLVLSLLIVIWQGMKEQEKDEILHEQVKGSQSNERDKTIWILVVTVAVVALMVGIYDGMAAELNAKQEINLAGWPRLLLGVGTITAGYLFDLGRRSYLNMIILCVAVINTSNVLLLSFSKNYLISHILFTSGMGFYVVYMMVMFFEIAPKSKNPVLCAGGGRMIHSLAMAVTTSAAVIFESLSPIALNVIMMILLLVMLFTFACGERITVKKGDAAQRRQYTETERIQSFAEQYLLTPREKDVLEAVSLSEKTLASIAGELGISERVLQRHLSSIYKKTGTQTRNGLTMVLHGITAHT